eukprot:COSAG04_NODE_1192_length_7801_cov_7.001298_15_plen_120_part_00
MRQNLDPWNEFSDKQLWDSLAHVRLEGYVSRQSGGLDMELLEGGSNRTNASHLDHCAVVAQLLMLADWVVAVAQCRSGSGSWCAWRERCCATQRSFFSTRPVSRHKHASRHLSIGRHLV